MQRRQFTTLLTQSALMLFVGQTIASPKVTAHECDRPDCPRCKREAEATAQGSEVSL